MKTVTEHIREHILTGLFGEDFSYEALLESEWSGLFEKLMRNRLIIGAFRYGKLNAKGKPQWDRMERVLMCVEEYRKTGNTEHLVDGANMFLLEFEEGEHPNKHWEATDDGDIHVKLKGQKYAVTYKVICHQYEDLYFDSPGQLAVSIEDVDDEHWVSRRIVTKDPEMFEGLSNVKDLKIEPCSEDEPLTYDPDKMDQSGGLERRRNEDH